MHARVSLDERGKNIEVWRLPTRASDDVLAGLVQTLAPDEISRAERFKFKHLHDSFVVTRAALRILLSRRLNLDPARIQFQYGSHGKPAIVSAADLRFNLAHSGDLAVVAMAAGCDIGVDVELVRPIPEMEQISARYFCGEEVEELCSHPPDTRQRAFFNLWTRKEAYIKAIGKGLSEPLNSFRVAVKEDASLSLLISGNRLSTDEPWTLQDLDIAPGYAAATVYADRQRPVWISPMIDPSQLLNAQ